MRQLVYKIYYVRYQAPLFFRRIKPVIKHSEWPKYYDQDCLKNLHQHSRSLIMIQISGRRPSLGQNTKILQKSTPTKVKRFLTSIAFDLNKSCKKVLTENC